MHDFLFRQQHNPSLASQRNDAQLQQYLLNIQESLDTLVFLLRSSTARTGNLLGIASHLSAMSDQVAEPKQQLPA